MSEALEVTLSIQQESNRVKALSGLAEHLPASLMSAALEVACSMQDDGCRARALMGLTEYLPDSLVQVCCF